MGPLHGLSIVEFAGIGPGPMCGMLLADMGARVVVVERPGGSLTDELALKGKPGYFLDRGKRSLALDVKKPAGRDLALRLIESADALIEGFRPGVMERLGLGPEACLARNPQLVYGRVTGWGRAGPLAQAAGHDLNYVAVTGGLELVQQPGQRPVVPPTVMGDAGGAVLLAFGIACALIEARRSGRGQVVDQSMVDAAAMLTSIVRATAAAGALAGFGAEGFFTNADFYDVYECRDGRFLAIAALERKFNWQLAEMLGLPDPGAAQYDPASWPERKRRLAALIKSKTQAEWQALFDGSDACVAPVRTMAEAPAHPQLAAIGSFVTLAGVTQPAPTPRFSATPPVAATPPPRPGEGADEVLGGLGLSATEIAALRAEGTVG